jgi:hypothetical protein
MLCKGCCHGFVRSGQCTRSCANTSYSQGEAVHLHSFAGTGEGIRQAAGHILPAGHNPHHMPAEGTLPAEDTHTSPAELRVTLSSLPSLGLYFAQRV